MTYNIDIINLFLNKFINNISLNNIYKNLNISVQTLKRWIFLYGNNILNKIPVKKEDLIKNKKIHGLNKKDKYINKEISKPSIFRILKENNITRKRCNIRVVCKDINKINDIRHDFSKETDEDIFLNSEFIDETSFCVNDIINYGYSEKGKEILKITKHSKNKERLTLLTSISKDTLKYQIIKGSVNSDIYLKFITDNKDLFKNRNLVQDNARIHHSKKVKSYGLENHINMIYNPPYT